MIRIRPYKASDVDTILSWCQDEKVFYQWTAGILGNYPITQEEFCFVESLMPFTAFDDTGIVGFFTLRNPDESLDELRFGFVIVNPHTTETYCVLGEEWKCKELIIENR